MSKVTRFAPSPTGTLHIGGVRTALFNFIYARQHNGKFLIRVEDTDLERSTKEFEKNILDNLNLLSLSPDEVPVRQSERTEFYLKAAETIINKGKGYYCECSQERLQALREKQQAKGMKPSYDGKCRNLALDKGPGRVLRLKTPREGEIVFHDMVRGEMIFQNSELDDLILLRSDHTPTYHLCNVVDDFEQGVTTVIRGEDHLSNTPRQIHIQNALGYPSLEYAHLPLVLGKDKKRLSKRDSATSLDEYLALGYLPSAILNMLARLGWSKGDQEIFYLSDLIDNFRIQEVQKAGAIFDLAKLNWINGQHLARLELSDFLDHLEPFCNALNIKITNKTNYHAIVTAMRSSSDTLDGLAHDLLPYFDGVQGYDSKALDKFLQDASILFTIRSKLESHEDWTEAELDKLLAAIQSELGLSTPQINQPIRIALTGGTKSPSLGLTLSLFNKSEALERIDALITFLG
ncbi:MAG: glutamate--tRNA ligase [Gammaproteobacteria bacterium]